MTAARQVRDLATPRTVEIALTTLWDEPTADSTQLVIDFGDGSTSGPLSSTVTFTDTTTAKGEAYTIRRVVATHTYASTGTYIASVTGCCRHATANASATDGFRIASTVALGAGSYGSPVMHVVDPQLQSDAPSWWTSGRTIPSATWWGGKLSTGHVSSFAESGIATLPPITWRTSTYGSQLEWTGPAQPAGASYSLSVVGQDIGDSTTMLDMIVETAPYRQSSPYCLDGPQLAGTIGVASTTTITSAWDAEALTLVEATSTLTLDTDLLSWTPGASDAGSYGLALLHVRTGMHAASCAVALHMPLTSTPCEDGLGRCGDHTTCVDTDVGFGCSCDEGYLRSSMFTCAAGCLPPTGPLCGFNNGFPVGMICCTDPTAVGGLACTCPTDPSTPPDPPTPSDTDPDDGGCRVASASPLWLAVFALVLARPRRRRRAMPRSGL